MLNDPPDDLACSITILRPSDWLLAARSGMKGLPYLVLGMIALVGAFVWQEVRELPVVAIIFFCTSSILRAIK